MQRQFSIPIHQSALVRTSQGLLTRASALRGSSLVSAYRYSEVPSWTACLSAPCSNCKAHGRRSQLALLAYHSKAAGSSQQPWPLQWVQPWAAWLAEPSFELWRRLLATLAVFILLQAGHYVPIPGVQPAFLHRQGTSAADLLSNLSPLPANLFMLSIGPTINASILLSVLLELPGKTFDSWREHMKHGVKGRETLKRLSRQMANVFAVGMALWHALHLRQLPVVPMPARLARPIAAAQTAFFLAAGAWLLAHLADLVEPWGLGEGTALIICTSIASRYLQMAGPRLQAILEFGPPWWAVGTAAGGLMGLLAFAVAVSGAEQRSALNFWHKPSARPATGFEAERNARLAAIAHKAKAPRAEKAASSHYLPLRLIPGGISRLLFADFMFRIVLVAAETVLGFLWQPLGLAVAELAAPAASQFIFPVFVFASNMVDLRSHRLAHDYSEYLYKAELNIWNVPPGAPTEAYLNRQQAQLRFLASACLAAAAAAAQLLDAFCTAFLGAPIGCTDLLLIVAFIAAVQDQVRVLARLPQLQQGLLRQQRILGSLPQQ